MFSCLNTNPVTFLILFNVFFTRLTEVMLEHFSLFQQQKILDLSSLARFEQRNL